MVNRAVDRVLAGVLSAAPLRSRPALRSSISERRRAPPNPWAAGGPDLGGPMLHAGTAEDRGLEDARAPVRFLDHANGTERRSKMRALRHQDILPQPQRIANLPPRPGRGRLVTNSSQKSAVNPLTRLASRSVMRRNFQSPHVEGPAATSDPCLIDLRPNCMSKLPRSDCRLFGRGIIGLAQQGATTSQRSRTTPERPCP